MDYSSLKVSELKQLLKERNLSQNGLKADLIARLEECNNSSIQQVGLNGDQHTSQAVSTAETTIIQPTVVEGIIEDETETKSLKRPAQTAVLTEEERKKMRSEKFGIVPEADQIAKRAERFGVGQAADKASVEKIKTRAERFGIVSPIAQTAEEKDRIEKRKERFGNVVNDNTSKTISSDSAIAKRQNRFGVVEQEKPKNNRTNNRNREFNDNRKFNNNRRRF